MSKAYLVPYVEVDGVRTWRDSQILALLEQSERDGSLPVIYYGNKGYTHKDFLKKIKAGCGTEFSVVKKDNKEVGWIFLDEMRWKKAQLHMCALREFWGSRELVDIALDIIALLMKRFTLITACIPEDNPRAIQFAEKTGWKRIASIPKYFYNHDGDYALAGIMFIITKEG
jgi:hypothetical protein